MSLKMKTLRLMLTMPTICRAWNCCPDEDRASAVYDEPVHGRQLAGDASDHGRVEGHCGGEDGDQQHWVVPEMHEDVEKFIELSPRLVHVELDRDEIEDDRHHEEDR